MEHGGTKWTDLEQAVEQEFLSKIIPVSNLSLESSSLGCASLLLRVLQRRLISDSVLKVYSIVKYLVLFRNPNRSPLIFDLETGGFEILSTKNYKKIFLVWLAYGDLLKTR